MGLLTLLLPVEKPWPISTRKTFGFSQQARTVEAASLSESFFIDSKSPRLTRPTDANEKITAGVESAIFMSFNKENGSHRVSTHIEPLENVTTIPSVGVIMPLEKLIDTPFLASSGRMTPALSHPTVASVNGRIIARGGGIFPVNTSKPLHIIRSALWSWMVRSGWRGSWFASWSHDFWS